MPFPSSTFTKSKWLAFFAELTAKIHHHNPQVVVDGCDMVRRLLTTRVSVAAFLEEGTFIQYLVDVIEGHSRVDSGTNARDQEMVDALLRTLFLIVDMMTSLVMEDDVYFTLLVAARSDAILRCLLQVMQCSVRLHFGRCSYYAHVILSLPLATALSPPHLAALEAVIAESGNVTLETHLRMLVELARKLKLTLTETHSVLSALAVAASDAVVRAASQRLYQWAGMQLRKFPSASSDPSAPSSLAADHDQPPHSSAGAERDQESEVTVAAVEEVLRAFGSCATHQQFFECMSKLWCATVAAQSTTAEALNETNTAGFLRFLRKAPQNQLDRVLFNSILSWVVVLGSVEALPPRFLGALMSLVPSHFIPYTAAALSIHLPSQPTSQVAELSARGAFTPLSAAGGGTGMQSTSFGSHHAMQKSSATAATTSLLVHSFHQDYDFHHYLRQQMSSTPPSEASTEDAALHSYPPPLHQEYSMAPRAAPPHHHSASHSSTLNHSQRAAAPVNAPVANKFTLLPVLSFLVFLERSCSPEQLSAWMTGGIAAVMHAAIAGASDLKSVLIDAPSHADGSLSDEAYLACSLESARTDLAIVATTACKLFAALFTDFHDALLSDFSTESAATADVMLPLLLGIILRNPTLACAEDKRRGGSMIHFVNHCHRAARSTSLGECAVGALDACLAIASPSRELVGGNRLRELVLALPALSRATRHSVIPHARALVYRVLLRVCCTPSQLVVTLREMPSLISTAVASILDSGKPSGSHPWECAAAAEWLAQVLRVSRQDPSTSQMFDLRQSALPLKLLPMVASMPLSYASCALLALCLAIDEAPPPSQASSSARTHADKDGPVASAVVPPLAPHGRQSWRLWSKILGEAGASNRTLARVAAHMQRTRISTRDVTARALAVYEDIAAQFAYTASTAKGFSRFVEAALDNRQGVQDSFVYEFTEAMFAAPTPSEIATMVATRFGIQCAPIELLKTSHARALEAASGLLSVWVLTYVVRPLQPLPPSFVPHVARLMLAEDVAMSSKLALASAVSAIHSTPSQPDLVASCADAAGDLLSASLRVRSHGPVLVAMQCRLLAEHKLASAAACESGWIVESVLSTAEKLAVILSTTANKGGHSLAPRGGATAAPGMTTAEVDSLQTVLSYVGSFLANSACAEPSQGFVERCASAWLQFLRGDASRSVAFRCTPFVVRSAVGRKVALHEVTKAGDAAARSCYGYVAHFCLVTFRALHPTVVGSAATAAYEALRGDVAAAMDGVVAAVVNDVDPFARAVVKVRGHEAIEEALVAADRRRQVPSLYLVRLLAAWSENAEAQLFIAKRPELLTSIITLATERPTTNAAVLALLTLRNLCFHPSLKIQMCQDARILTAMRNALLRVSTSTDPRHLGDPSTAPLVPLEHSVPVHMRQEIAARCFAALAHGSERCRAYVRGALQTRDHSTEALPLQISSVVNQISPSGERCSRGRASVAAEWLPANRVEFSASQLEDFATLMNESLQLLTDLEVIVAAPT